MLWGRKILSKKEHTILIMNKNIIYILLLGLLIALSMSNLLAQDIYIGMEKTDLIEVLGEPSSEASRAGRELLFYGGGIQITLRGGEVHEVKGADYGYAPPTKVEVSNSSNATLPEVEQLIVKQSEEGHVDVISPESGDEDIIDAVTDYHKFSRNEMSEAETQEAIKHVMVEEMELSDQQANNLIQGLGKPDEENIAERTMGIRIVAFSVYLIATLVFIKIAFMYFEITSLWSEPFKIAVGYASYHLILSFIPYGLAIRELFKLDDLMGIPVLTLLVFHLTALNQGVTALKIGFGGAVVCYLALKATFVISALGALNTLF